mmetsp:Transcript_62775/g.99476  ORF Transcript_62775/g.99476 Transcript_62775/m.99476 type:complete len:224 (-) Transcript_62775:94-765(-)
MHCMSFHEGLASLLSAPHGSVLSGGDPLGLELLFHLEPWKAESHLCTASDLCHHLLGCCEHCVHHQFSDLLGSYRLHRSPAHCGCPDSLGHCLCLCDHCDLPAQGSSIPLHRRFGGQSNEGFSYVRNPPSRLFDHCDHRLGDRRCCVVVRHLPDSAGHSKYVCGLRLGDQQLDPSSSSAKLRPDQCNAGFEKRKATRCPRRDTGGLGEYNQGDLLNILHLIHF